MARRVGSVAALALAVSALGAQAASATYHEMVVREVYPGSVLAPESEYVELQMYAAGQNLVSGHRITLYDAAGGEAGSAKFTADVKNGANQATILAATPAAEAEFGIVADLALAPANTLTPDGGAVCWESLDCVTWGTFPLLGETLGGIASRAGRHPRRPGAAADDRARLRLAAGGVRRQKQQRRRLRSRVPRAASQLGDADGEGLLGRRRRPGRRRQGRRWQRPADEAATAGRRRGRTTALRPSASPPQ